MYLLTVEAPSQFQHQVQWVYLQPNNYHLKPFYLWLCIFHVVLKFWKINPINPPSQFVAPKHPYEFLLTIDYSSGLG